MGGDNLQSAYGAGTKDLSKIRAAVVNETFPSIAAIAVAEGTYDEIRYRIARIEEEQIPAELADDTLAQSSLAEHSLVISGAYIEPVNNDLNGNSTQDEVPFLYVTDQDFSLELASSQGYSIVTGLTTNLYLAFQLDTWFDVAIDSIAELGSEDLQDGVLVLNSTSQGGASSVYEDVEEGIKTSGRLGHESDDDHFDGGEDVEDDSGSAEREDEDSEDSTDNSED
jgi:hypothetical protein